MDASSFQRLSGNTQDLSSLPSRIREALDIGKCLVAVLWACNTSPMDIF